MGRKGRRVRIFAHAVLAGGLVFSLAPVYLALAAASQPLEAFGDGVPLALGGHLVENFSAAWQRGDFAQQGVNSLIMAVAIVVGKCLLATTAAFSVTYFRWPGRGIVFWLVLISLMLPLEVRIVPTYGIAANALGPVQTILEVTRLDDAIRWLSGIRVDLHLSLLNSYVGLTLPVMATVTGTFLFRQFYLTVPDELLEAAKIDGAGPFRFFFQILLPLSKTNLAALATISFIFGWNQYLWPLLITTEPEMMTLVMGLQNLIPGVDDPPQWNHAMAATLMVMLPPVVVILVMQTWFVRGLINSEK